MRLAVMIPLRRAGEGNPGVAMLFPRVSPRLQRGVTLGYQPKRQWRFSRGKISLSRRRERDPYSLRVIVACCALFVASTLSAAEEQHGNPAIVYQKKTVIDFSDMRVSGELMKPTGELIQSKKRPHFPPLVELKRDFRQELFLSLWEVQHASS